MNLFNVNKFELDPKPLLNEIKSILDGDKVLIPTAISNATVKFADDLIDDSKKDYQSKGRSSTNNFLKEISKTEIVRTEEKEQQISIDILSNAFRNSPIYDDFYYGIVLEYGAGKVTKVGKNLLKGLKAWVEKKGIVFDNEKTKVKSQRIKKWRDKNKDNYNNRMCDWRAKNKEHYNKYSRDLRKWNNIKKIFLNILL
jgi:hypothetical protein